jgi:hypothetical protein
MQSDNHESTDARVQGYERPRVELLGDLNALTQAGTKNEALNDATTTLRFHGS